MANENTLDLSSDDPVYWLTNGVGETPSVEFTPRDRENGDGGDAQLWVGGCHMLTIHYSDDLGDEGVKAIAEAIAASGLLIYGLRHRLARIRFMCGRVLSGDLDKKSLRWTVEEIRDEVHAALSGQAML